MAIDVIAPMPGTIKEIIVKAGDPVKEGDKVNTSQVLVVLG